MEGGENEATIGGERSEKYLYMFVRRAEDGIYMLYEIDVVNCLRNKLDDVPLTPLIVFSANSLSSEIDFAFSYVKPYFYFIGAEKNQVFCMKKAIIKPSEKKRGSKFVKPITPMHGDKLRPLAFSYKKKLYVITKGYYIIWERIGKLYYDFEVYNPKTKSWSHLGNKSLIEVSIKSHLVHNDIVYFTTNLNVILSFNLIDDLWISILDPYGVLVNCPEIYVKPHPSFDTQIQMIGNTIFGGIYRFGNSYFDIAASSSVNPIHDLFLRPNLAHDKIFYDHVYSVPRDLRHQLSLCSKFVVTTIDNNNEIMCVVGYGNDPYDKLANYASLAFFKVTGNSYKDDILSSQQQQPLQETNEVAPLPYSWNCQFTYANDEDGEHVNFFEAKFISSCFMPIDTEKEVTPGLIYGCVLV